MDNELKELISNRIDRIYQKHSRYASFAAFSENDAFGISVCKEEILKRVYGHRRVKNKRFFLLIYNITFENFKINNTFNLEFKETGVSTPHGKVIEINLENYSPAKLDFLLTSLRLVYPNFKLKQRFQDCGPTYKEYYALAESNLKDFHKIKYSTICPKGSYAQQRGMIQALATFSRKNEILHDLSKK